MTVRERTVASDGVVTLTLTRPDGARLPDWAPGAHIDLLL
ncbi:oxidoreductase, partial [Pseudonocardia sp. KRD-291]|nr:oxidoreductase [Pseudonocardia sp. KRD291]